MKASNSLAEERIMYIWNRPDIDSILAGYGRLTHYLHSSRNLEMEIEGLGLNHSDLLTRSDREKLFAGTVRNVWEDLVTQSTQKGYDRLTHIVKVQKVPMEKIYTLSNFVARQRRIYHSYAKRLDVADNVANDLANAISHVISERITSMGLDPVFTEYERTLLCSYSGVSDIITDILFKSSEKGINWKELLKLRDEEELKK